MSANVGDPITLECIIEAYPKSNNHWAKVPNGELTRTRNHALGSDHTSAISDEDISSDTDNNRNNSNKNHIHFTYHPHNRLNNRSAKERIFDENSDISSDGDIAAGAIKDGPAKAQIMLEQSPLENNNNNNEGAFVSVKQNNINSYTYQLKLTIPSLRRQDFGKYTCFARNNLGASESSVLIRGRQQTKTKLEIIMDKLIS